MHPHSRRPQRRRHLLATVVVALALGLALAACSSGSGTPSSQSTPQPTPSSTSAAPGAAYCAGWAQVRADFAAYRSIDVVSGGTNAVRAYLDRLQTSLQQLRAAADAQLRARVDAFTASLTTLADTLTTATLPVDRRAQVRAASAAVNARWDDLLAAAAPGCPTATPSTP